MHVGEWGAYQHTPHDVALAWMKDCLELWEEAGWGWGMWNFSLLGCPSGHGDTMLTHDNWQFSTVNGGLDYVGGFRPPDNFSDPAGDDIFHWWSYHSGGGLFLLTDGSARFVSYNTDYNTIDYLHQRDDGNVISEF